MLSTRTEIKEDIQANLIRDVSVLDDSSVQVEFTYDPSPEISLPEKGEIPAILTFTYKNSAEFLIHENAARRSAENMFLHYATGANIRSFKFKRIGNIIFSRSELVADPEDTRSFICFGRVEFFVDPFSTKGKAGFKYLKDVERAPIFGFALASKKPHLYAITRRG